MQRLDNCSTNPVLLASTLRAIERRQLLESQDASEFARRIGVTPDGWQENLLRSDVRYILLNCSRQSGKSTVTSILALHEALYHAPALVLLVAPSMRQSQELFRRVKEHYLKLGPLTPRISEESALRLEIGNGSRIVCLPGKEATVRGYSDASLLILDEASRIDDELYQALRPMLAVSSRGRMVLLSTPFGKRGFFFHEWAEGGPEWWRVKITAHDCPRISRAWLDQERAAIGDWWFTQEYLCEFVDTQDQVFAYDDIMAALDPSVTPLFGGSNL